MATRYPHVRCGYHHLWHPANGRTRCCSWNWSSYGDRTSKLDPLQRGPVGHWELQCQRVRACKNAGIIKPTDILNINPREFLAKRIILSTAGDAYVEQMVAQNPRRTAQTR